MRNISSKWQGKAFLNISQNTGNKGLKRQMVFYSNHQSEKITYRTGKIFKIGHPTNGGDMRRQRNQSPSSMQINRPIKN